MTTATTTVAASSALAVAGRIAATLADPRTVLPDRYRSDARRWPQSLAGGAAGIALLHVELASAGHGDWEVARAWLAEAATGNVSAAGNARLFFGAPALAHVFHLATEATGLYRQALAVLDDATLTVTREAVAGARARMDRGEQPELREFDLIRGLAGLGAYHLTRHPGHPVTHDVLSCLALLTEPLPDGVGDLPPWWTSAAPSGEPSPDLPGGHGNFGMAHGISAVLAVLSLAILRNVSVPGIEEAAHRICAWTDQWRHGDSGTPWWPGFISVAQARAGCVDPTLRPRPSWCYGIAGTARAQQLAGMALCDLKRRKNAESAILAVVRDPSDLDRLDGIGLCHGTAGLLQAAWRMAADATTTAITAELPGLTERLITRLGSSSDDNPELLDGTAGAALALHTTGTGSTPQPGWDSFLALA